MAASSLALLGRTSEVSGVKSSKSDEQTRRVRLTSLVCDDAELIARVLEEDAEVIARLASKGSCCSTLPTDSWMTSYLSCPSEDDLESESDGEEDVRNGSLLSFTRVRTDSGLGMPDALSQPTDGPTSDEDNSNSNEDGDEEDDVRNASKVSLLSFQRVRTNSDFGMPVSPSSTSPRVSMFSSTAPPHADRGDADQARAVPLRLSLSALIGDGVDAFENVKVNSLPRPRPTLTLMTTSFEAPTDQPTQPGSVLAAMPHSPHLTMAPTIAPMVSPVMATTTGTPNSPQFADQMTDGRGCGRRSRASTSFSTSLVGQPRNRTRTADTVLTKQVNHNCESTTICFRNLPNNYTTQMVLELLEKNGLNAAYDFVYVPHDFKRLPTRVNIGYFFANFISHEIAESALATLEGFKDWAVLSNKVLTGSWAEKTQGRSACIERCKYFTFMHEHVPEECKPMMFERGVLMPFDCIR